MTQNSQIVGNYEFLGIVERPKAGVTYKVRNLVTGEFEVLRMLPGASYDDPEARERLLREIRIHTRLSHPNIVAFHDALELDGHLVMTAQFVEGGNLAELCLPGPMPSVVAIRAIAAVLAGLEEAHALGIVHRGITAEHVVITRGGEAMLGGFGLAKPASDVNLTVAGAVVGDARYISPEQVVGDSLDARADLYSVGILLFQALTGKVPFSASNDFDIMMAQVSRQPPRPSALNPGVAPELEQIVLRALAKKPGDRFPNARDFRLALEAVQRPVAMTAPLEAPPNTATPRLLPPLQAQKRPRAAFVFGALGLVIALGIVALLVFH